ncbi:MAG: hypothetical protein WBB07_01745 [Mycobacterium sp.]
MTQQILSDLQIAELSAGERRELIRRLQRPMSELMPHGFVPWLRRAHLGLMIGGALCMIPWVVYLAFTLPRDYTVRDWPLTWVGFDSLLIAFMAGTAFLAWLHRLPLVFFAFTTGILLLCDAWFDITTAGPGELPTAAVSAVLGGLLAAVLIAGAVSLVRLNAGRNWLLERGESLWRLPVLP